MATRTSHVLAVLLARGRGQRRLERLEDDFLVDALLVGDGIDDHQDFFVHLSSSRHAGFKPAAPGAPCVFPRPAARAAGRPLRPRSSPRRPPSSGPRKRLRPSSGCASSTNTVSPTNRAKCSAVRSGRSSPGEDTSRVYWPATGSSTSSTSLTARLTRSQSSTVIPAARVYVETHEPVAPAGRALEFPQHVAESLDHRLQEHRELFPLHRSDPAQRRNKKWAGGPFVSSRPGRRSTVRRK